MKDVWFISGLGADERAFQFLDLKGWNHHFIQWISPADNEPIEAYAQRLLLQIEGTNPVLVGYSFGGMMAIELARLIPAAKVIILASVKNKDELPPWFRLAGQVSAYAFVPTHWILKPMSFYYWLFGAERREDKQLLSEIIQATDLDFLAWAMKVITRWQNDFIPPNLVHIHGTVDRVLPYRYVQADISVEDAGHFMLVTRAAEVSGILHRLID
ncbi:MAG TPA: alpha/beta hydrolase [Edaphocola sp.]|nr:alpha/beta hydrolase [Edaphocola sp.]